MATKVVKNLKRSHSVEDICEAKVPKGDDEPGERREISRSVFLREALKKIELIQTIISHGTSDDEAHSGDDSFTDSEDDQSSEIDAEINSSSVDAESLGFAMCARETISFLINEGFPADSNLIRALKDRLVGRMHGLPF